MVIANETPSSTQAPRTIAALPKRALKSTISSTTTAGTTAALNTNESPALHTRMTFLTLNGAQTATAATSTPLKINRKRKEVAFVEDERKTPSRPHSESLPCTPRPAKRQRIEGAAPNAPLRPGLGRRTNGLDAIAPLLLPRAERADEGRVESDEDYDDDC